MSCFPDFGKAPADYLATVVNAIEAYPIELIQKLGDLQTGLPAKCKFLPSVAEVVELGNKLLDEAREHEAMQLAIENRRQYRPMSMEEYHAHRTGKPRGKPRPFPKLWEVFADDREIFAKLERCLTFETLSRASLLLATQGTTASREFLERVV